MSKSKISHTQCEWTGCTKTPVWHISGINGGGLTWDYCDEHFKARLAGDDSLEGISYHPAPMKKKGA